MSWKMNIANSLTKGLKSKIGRKSPIRLGWHFAKAFIAAVRFGFPARRLTIIGITGTDGKTTTVNMTAHILLYSGIKTGALSTAFIKVNELTQWNETQKTSPSPFMIQGFLKRLTKAGCTHAVLEVSSHGLVQGRVHHTFPKVAAITNTSMEHLDYHGTIERYRKDKGKLFRMLKGGGTKVLNTNDATLGLYSRIPSDNTIVYSSDDNSKATLYLSDVSIAQTKSAAVIHKNDEACMLSLPIPGIFNLENALCAIGCSCAVGIPLEKSAKALETFKGTPGRMELIDEGQPFAVYVDFTVTPAAYEKTVKTLRQMIKPGKRILVLTGSCGDRMKEKRPIVGRLCSELADVVVVSNEDPYTEDPQKIIDEVWAGVDQSKCKARQIIDRREAMEYLFNEAKEGDAVMLCGKGSDTTMWTAKGQIPWNEREIAREILKNDTLY